VLAQEAGAAMALKRSAEAVAELTLKDSTMDDSMMMNTRWRRLWLEAVGKRIWRLGNMVMGKPRVVESGRRMALVRRVLCRLRLCMCILRNGDVVGMGFDGELKNEKGVFSVQYKGLHM